MPSTLNWRKQYLERVGRTLEKGFESEIDPGGVSNYPSGQFKPIVVTQHNRVK